MREFAAERFGRLGDSSVEVLDALRSSAIATDHPKQAKLSGPGFSSSMRRNFNPMIQDAASLALARLAPGEAIARRGLALLLTSDDPRERVAAAMALGPSDDPDAFDVVPALLAACRDDDPLVAAEAITALGRVGDRREAVLTRLRAFANHDGSPGSRAKAALRRLEREEGKGREQSPSRSCWSQPLPHRRSTHG